MNTMTIDKIDLTERASAHFLKIVAGTSSGPGAEWVDNS